MGSASGCQTNTSKSPSPLQSKPQCGSLSASHGRWVGWGEGWEVTAPLSSQQPRTGPSLRGSGQSRTGCSVWQGCPRDAFISRESSLALVVQEFGVGSFFFFSPVTKSWKTPLNNISEHGWNKDRAWGGREAAATKPEIIKAAAAASHHLRSPSRLDFPAGVVAARSAPSGTRQPPACRGSPHRRAPQDSSRAGSAQRGEELQRRV